MRRITSIFVLIAVLAAVMLPAPFAPVREAAAAEVWIEVDSAEELAAIGSPSGDLTANYRLTKDIDLTGYSHVDGKGWKPIETFQGKLDGNGYVIRNMTINRPNENSVGLFGNALNATITNVHLVDMQVNGHSDVGGLAGFITTSSITGSSASGTVTGNENVGGLVGYNSLSDITDSYAQGQVVIGSDPVESFGGLIGYSTGHSTGRITGSYSTTSVAAGTKSGGLIGDKSGTAVIQSSYWDTQTSGHATSSGGGSGKTTADMKRASTYAGWDFTNVWGMVEGSTYPLHRSNYERVILATLTVEDAGGTEQPLDREFESDYGEYAVHVINKVDTITVTGTAVSTDSTVSVDSGTGTKELDLDPGENDFEIEVTGSNGLKAVYRLTVYRDAGTDAYPHRINAAEQLALIGEVSEGYGMDDAYVLDASLDLSALGAGDGWMPIGSGTEPFTGSFDGNSHTIRNMTIDREGMNDVGLFGYASGAAISNVSLLNASVLGGDRAGGLIGTAVDTDVRGTSAQGTVEGNQAVGGLIGSLDPDSTVDESYSAAFVTGASDAGGLIGEGSGTVSDSFWDTEASGQATSAGGGTGRTTAQMMQQATYSAAGWTFGTGQTWGIIEGTTYPMPFAGFEEVLLNALTLTATGATVAWGDAFDPQQGVNAVSLSTPVATLAVSAVPADPDATVTVNGASAGEVELGLGDNAVTIRVAGDDEGWRGEYRLTISVPEPEPTAVEVPADGLYGIGDQLDVVVSYDHPVDAAGTPELPITLDSGETAASYAGKPAGHPEQLLFRYIVSEGDHEADGMELGDAIAAPLPNAVTALGDAVTLDLPAPLPDTSGIIVDGLFPTLDLIPSATAPTSGTVTVAVYADGTGSGIDALEWADGVRDASYFATGGTAVSAGAFEAVDNGNYTVYAVDEAGNSAIETIAVSNIVTSIPTVLLDYAPKSAVRDGVDVTVTATVGDAAAGNAIADLRWAAGELTAADFAAPGFGASILGTGTFRAEANGTYTVYAADSAGNARVETMTIGNIVTAAPTITLDYAPKTVVRGSVDVTATATVGDAAAGNAIADLRWAAGELAAADFAAPGFGASILGTGTFRVEANGTYTVYAADRAGNARVETIAITNIAAPSSSGSGTQTETNPNLARYTIIPGQAYTLTFGGSSLQIPAGAVEQVMTVTIERVTEASSDLVGPEQQLLSGIYELKKDVAGNFKLPVRLSFHVSEAEWDEQHRPILAYYDEQAEEWVEIGDMLEDGKMTGETDHFTKFAAIAVPQEPASEHALTDIAGHWAEDAIREGVATGLIDGYADDTFRPDKAVSRAEFVQLLARSLSLQPEEGELAFADRNAIPDWAADAVRAAVQADILTGYPDGTFRPHATINRMEMAVMIGQAAGLPAASGSATSFADDAAIAGWAVPAVQAAVEAGLLQGQAGNRFQPLASATRAEAVTLVLRLSAYLRASSVESESQ